MKISKNKGNEMVSLSSKSSQKKQNKSSITDEFENYVKRQCSETTFNGVKIDTISLYNKPLKRSSKSHHPASR